MRPTGDTLPRLRCFIALGLAPAPGASLRAGLARLRNFPELSVPPPGNLHVTLAFLGDLDAAGVRRAADAARVTAVGAGGRWTVGWGNAGAFPSAGRPRVVWLSLADPVITTTVQGSLAAELRLRGLPADDRPFRPHLTLARVRSSLTPELVEDLSVTMMALELPLPASVEALVLYRSKPGCRASVYEELARASL